jgi:hypothetical protein
MPLLMSVLFVIVDTSNIILELLGEINAPYNSNVMMKTQNMLETP